MLHSCGKNDHLHEIWQEMDCVKGIELNPYQVDILAAKRKFGNKVISTCAGPIPGEDFDARVNKNLEFLKMGGSVLYCPREEKLLIALKRQVGETVRL